MKKFIALLISAVLLLSLVSCTVSNDEDIKQPTSVTVGNEEAQKSDDAIEAKEDEEVKKDEQPAKESATIEETVILDESGVKITAKKLVWGGFMGPELKLLIENNSGTDLTIQCQNASINGYMVDPMMSVDVVDGKKANDAITFLDSELDACGITNIADMEFSFHIFTSEDWEDYLNTSSIQIKTSIANTYNYSFDDSGNIAYDKDGIKIVIKGLSENDSVFGPGVIVYIENNSDEPFTVQNRDISVNGFMTDSIFSCSVMPGKKAIDAITFLNSDLEENEITEIKDVELSFHIFNNESWDDIVDTDVTKITF